MRARKRRELAVATETQSHRGDGQFGWYDNRDRSAPQIVNIDIRIEDLLGDSVSLWSQRGRKSRLSQKLFRRLPEDFRMLIDIFF